MQEHDTPSDTSQNISTLIIATTLFTVIFLYLQVLWLIFLAFGVIGWISLLKEQESMQEQHKTRYHIFLVAMAASSLIGLACNAFISK